MHNLSTLAQQMGPWVLVPILFVVVGIATFAAIVWGLVTGGPRAWKQPGAPYLYDRVYYLIWLVTLCGWSGALLASASETTRGPEVWGFLLGWSVLAIGMASLFMTRMGMMIKGARYLGEHGFWAMRWYNRMQANQFSRVNAKIGKLFPLPFLIAGVVALVVSLAHLTEAITDIRAGAMAIIHFVTGP